MSKYFVINTEAAIYRDGMWLVGIRSRNEAQAAGLLSFIGGTVDHSDSSKDTLESAVIREVKEEICVDIKVVNFVNDTHFVSNKGNHNINIVFLCEIVSGEPRISDTQEIESLKWLSTEEIINYPDAPTWLLESVRRASTLIR